MIVLHIELMLHVSLVQRHRAISRKFDCFKSLDAIYDRMQGSLYLCEILTDSSNFLLLLPRGLIIHKHGVFLTITPISITRIIVGKVSSEVIHERLEGF